jgi:DNA mismatch endonuclease (patch repair protein)
MGLTRSEQMSRIRGKNTAPELWIRKGLWAAGLRYRLQFRTPGGRADIALPARKVAIFIDGCFWHGCPEHYVRPRSRNDFWDRKLAENIARDRRQTLALDAQGWRVLRIWEHEVVETPDLVISHILEVAGAQQAHTAELWRVVRVEYVAEMGNMERRHVEDLRHPERQRLDIRQRSTKKTGRVPAVSMSRTSSKKALPSKD